MITGEQPPLNLRPATRADSAAIRRMTRQARVNPLGIRWQRFLVLVSAQGEVLACGQIKPHGPSADELASIVTHPNYRGQGLASRLIRALMSAHGPPLLLTCRRSLRPFYERFGFRMLEPAEMPPYYLRLHRAAVLLSRLTRKPITLTVMKWDG